ncbi:MAG: pilus assembly FimT family protein [Desulfobulbales bacterium]
MKAPSNSRVQRPFPPFQSDRCRSSGFTIVEVIVILAVIGALTMVAYPGLSKWVPNYQLKAAAQELYGNLQKAKLHAVKTNRDVTFTFTTSPDCSAATRYTFIDADGQAVASVDLQPGGVCIKSSDFDAASGFDPTSLPTVLSATGKYTVTMGHGRIPARTYAISQSTSGSISIQ